MSLLMDTLEKAQRDAARTRALPLPREIPTITLKPELKIPKVEKLAEPVWEGNAARETAVVSLLALIVGVCVAAAATVAVRSLTRTPDFLSAMPREVSAKPGGSAVPALPVLQGIVRNGSSAFCLINGQIYRPGDLWQEYLVQTVEDGAVVFLHPSGKIVTLRVNP
jgi:hypothetical protein